MAICTSGDRPDTFQAQRGHATPRNNTLSDGTPSPPPPPYFSPPLPGGLPSVGNVTDKEQIELFITCTITLQPINNRDYGTRLLKAMSTEKALLAMDWSALYRED